MATVVSYLNEWKINEAAKHAENNRKILKLQELNKTFN